MKFEPLLKAAPFSGTRVKPFDGTKQYLSTGDLQDDSLSFVDVTFKDKPSRADIAVREGDVLFARMKGTKKVLRVTQELADTIVSTGFAVLRPGKDCDPAYLATYLSTDYFERQKEKYCSGAIQPAITNGGIEKLQIPLPPVDDQIRIAHLLGKVEGLIAQRMQHLQQLDELTKSVFLEMFGDPVRNERGWETSPIEGFCEAVIDCPHSTPEYSEVETGYYCVRSSDIVEGYLDLAKTYQVDEQVFEDRITRYRPQPNDIVYSREGGRLGNAARIIGREPICLGQRMMLFKVSSANRPEFLWALLESVQFKSKLRGLIGGGAAPRVNIKDLKKLVVAKPDPDLQLSFSKFVLRIDQLRERYQQHVMELEALYGSLSQQAFKGELDLSRVPLTASPAEGEQNVTVAPLPPQAFEPAIHLPDTGILPAALEISEMRGPLLTQWLEAYHAQLGDATFSVDRFLAAAQTRLAELHPDTDFELGVADYEYTKKWVFEALRTGKLEQALDDAGNRIQIKTGQA
jgi:type I restriction enzyme S subunit